MFKAPSMKQFLATTLFVSFIFAPQWFPAMQNFVYFTIATFFTLVLLISILVELVAAKIPKDKAEEMIIKTLVRLDDYTDNRIFNLVNFSIISMAIFTVQGKELALLYVCTSHMVNTHSGVLISRLSKTAK